jgi:REP element-mobilizing transposase RayT
MARPLRLDYPGAWHHVINRGAARQAIFNTDEQRAYFLSLLATTHERFNAEWHAYCLMSNHYHLLLRTPEGNLQRIMRHLGGLYTQFYNRTEGRDGPLMRGRYRAVLVEAESHWLELSRYIHRNPQTAGLVQNLADYPWSSYPAYIGRVPAPSWLQTSYILGAVGPNRPHIRYQAYMASDNDGALSAFYNQLKISPVLGSDDFKAHILSGVEKDIDRPELRTARMLPTLSQIVQATCRHFEVQEAVIWQSRRGRGSRSRARSVAMYLCQEVGDMRLSVIADVFGLTSYASAGATIRQLKARIERDAALGATLERLKCDLASESSRPVL